MYIELENSVEFALNVFTELDENETEQFFKEIAERYEETACRQWAALMLNGTGPDTAQGLDLAELDTDTYTEPDTDLAPETVPEITVLQTAPETPQPQPEPQPKPTVKLKTPTKNVPPTAKR